MQLQYPLNFHQDLFPPTLLLLQYFQCQDHLKIKTPLKKFINWNLLLQAHHPLHTENHHKTFMFNYNSRPFIIQTTQIFNVQRNLHWKIFVPATHFIGIFQVEKSRVERLLEVWFHQRHCSKVETDSEAYTICNYWIHLAHLKYFAVVFVLKDLLIVLWSTPDLNKFDLLLYSFDLLYFLIFRLEYFDFEFVYIINFN